MIDKLRRRYPEAWSAAEWEHVRDFPPLRYLTVTVSAQRRIRLTAERSLALAYRTLASRSPSDEPAAIIDLAALDDSSAVTLVRLRVVASEHAQPLDRLPD
jgi:hypothetical protein